MCSPPSMIYQYVCISKFLFSAYHFETLRKYYYLCADILHIFRITLKYSSHKLLQIFSNSSYTRYNSRNRYVVLNDVRFQCFQVSVKLPQPEEG